MRNQYFRGVTNRNNLAYLNYRSVGMSAGGVVSLVRYALCTQREGIRGQINRAEQGKEGGGLSVKQTVKTPVSAQCPNWDGKHASLSAASRI